MSFLLVAQAILRWFHKFSFLIEGRFPRWAIRLVSTILQTEKRVGRGVSQFLDGNYDDIMQVFCHSREPNEI